MDPEFENLHIRMINTVSNTFSRLIGPYLKGTCFSARKYLVLELLVRMLFIYISALTNTM